MVAVTLWHLLPHSLHFHATALQKFVALHSLPCFISLSSPFSLSNERLIKAERLGQTETLNVGSSLSSRPLASAQCEVSTDSLCHRVLRFWMAPERLQTPTRFELRLCLKWTRGPKLLMGNAQAWPRLLPSSDGALRRATELLRSWLTTREGETFWLFFMMIIPATRMAEI